MDRLIKISDRILRDTDTSFTRYLYNDIEFDNRLIILYGCRGVGKTTLIIQRLKNVPDPSTCIYLSLDHITFIETKLVDVIDDLYDLGYRTFALDEVHKYENWSIEVKNIYDSYKDVTMLITASSALNITTTSGDLSRRADRYELKGFSFREFIHFEYGLALPGYTIDELIKNHMDIASDVLDKIDIPKAFKKYLNKGYYPFYKESGKKYHERISSIINQVIDVDLPPIFNIDYNSTRQVKKLLAVISRLSPFSPNIAKLSRDLGISRNSLLAFIDYLDSASIINTLKSNRKSDSVLTKPDKIFLENTNIAYAMTMTEPNIGNLREAFVMNTLSPTYNPSTPQKGDFMINDRYVIEVGGPNKTRHQIYGIPNAYLVQDGVLKGGVGNIPMWLFGFLL